MTEFQRKRSSRATAQQILRMLDFFDANSGLAEGKYGAIYGKVENRKKWEELTIILNSMQGGFKTVEQWQVVWRDIKSRTTLKVREKRRNNESLESIQKSLNTIELRFLEVTGEKTAEENKQEFEIKYLQEDEFDLPLQNEDSKEYSESPTASHCYGFNEDHFEQIGSECSSRKRKRLDLNETNTEVMDLKMQHFERIAQIQADAMMMQAEAAKIHAEAQKIQAEAAKVQAEAMMKIANAVDKLSNGIQNLANVSMSERQHANKIGTDTNEFVSFLEPQLKQNVDHKT